MTPAVRQAADELRRLMGAATAGPWRVRPQKYDDWGWIRGPVGEDGFAFPVANALGGQGVTEEEKNGHRKAGTDPYEHNAAFIAAARNHLPAMLDALKEADARAHKAEQDLARMTVNAGARLEEANARADALAARVAELEVGLNKLMDMWVLEAIHRHGDPRHAYFGYGCVAVAMEALHETRADFDRRASALLADTKGGEDGA